MQALVAGIKVTLGIFFAWFLGLAGVIHLLIALMAIDILAGVIVGAMTKTLSSDVMWKGIGKKAIVLLLVGVGELIDHYIGLQLAIGLGEFVAGFYCAHEGLSILENAVLVGLPVPAALRDTLAKLSPDKPNGNGGGQIVG